MNRIDRLQAILTILQSKRVVKAEEIATRFNISIRTVYRDLRALEEGGVPIGAEAGVGYFLLEGYHLPPVMFTNEEARALQLAGKFIEKNSDKGVSLSFTSALTKIRAVLDNKKKDELDGLEQKIEINPFSYKITRKGDLFLDLIKQALAQNRVVKISYSSRTAEATERETEPIGICFYYGSWHLIAYCRLRNEYRDFRLDRIKEFEVLKDTFLRINHLSLKDYLRKAIRETELVEVIIRVSKKKAVYIQDSKYNMGLISEEAFHDEVQMTFNTFSIPYFAQWLISLGDEASVVAPVELHNYMQGLVGKLYDKYLKGGRH